MQTRSRSSCRNLDAVPKMANQGQGDMTNTDIQDGVEKKGAQNTSNSTPELGQGSTPQDSKIPEASSGKAIYRRYTTEHLDIAQTQRKADNVEQRPLQRPGRINEHSYASHHGMPPPPSTVQHIHKETRRDTVRTQRKTDNSEQRLLQRPDPTNEHSYASHQEMLQPSSTTPHEENRRDRVRTQRKADNGEQRPQHHPDPFNEHRYEPPSTTHHEENRRDMVQTQRKTDNGEQRPQHHPDLFNAHIYEPQRDMPHRPLATQHIQEEYHSAIQFEDQENEIVSGQHHHARPVDRYELPPPQHQVGPRVQRRLDVSQMYPGNNKADQHTRADMRGIHDTQQAGLGDLQTCAPSMDRQYIPSQHNGAAPSEIGRLPTGNPTSTCRPAPQS